MTERVPCESFSWSLFLLGHPQHLTIIRRRIEFHATNNYCSVLNNCLSLTQLACNYLLFNALGKVRFLLGGGGGGLGLRRGGSLLSFLEIGEGQTCFILNRGRVTVSFWYGKKLLHVASILYIQAKLQVKINLNYLQVSKNLYK